MAAKLRKGDKVVVLAGKDKGKTGEISSVNPSAGKAVVEGINMAVRHTRQSQESQGGRIPISRSLMRTARQHVLASAWKATKKCALQKPRGT
jgi:large subunit ribosomal protein L24